MRAASQPLEAEAETDTGDNSALRLMLSYVEAECLRIGATEAARYAALAAALMQGSAVPLDRPRSARVH